MNNPSKRRLFALERSFPVPLTAQRYIEQVEQRMRRIGTTREEAAKSLLAELSNDDLRRLSAELEQIAFDGNTGNSVRQS